MDSGPKDKPNTKKSNEPAKENQEASRVPHFDTQVRESEPNTDVEVSKGSLHQGYQTDTRPK